MKANPAVAKEMAIEPPILIFPAIVIDASGERFPPKRAFPKELCDYYSAVTGRLVNYVSFLFR
jgi:hypothetical protein